MKKWNLSLNNQKILRVKSFALSVRDCLFQLFSEKKDILAKTFIPLFIIALGYYGCTISQRQIVRNIYDVFAISDEIRNFYTNKNDYWGLNTDFVIKNKIISNRFIKQNKIVLSGQIEILIGSGKEAETVMPLTQTFDIVISNLNKAQCMSYAEANISDENLLKLQKLSIVNGKDEYVFEWGGKYGLPVQKYATKDLCLDKDNIVIWSIK